MPFPTSPSIGTLYTNPLGSVYRFNIKGAWQLHKIGRGYLPESGRLSLAPDVMPTMIVGAAFSQAVTASGGTAPYTYTLAGGALPAGLTMTTGTISGTPTTAGPYAFTIRAVDSTGGTALTVERAYSGQVLTSAITILPDSISGLLVGKPYSQTFTASGGTAPYTWAIATGALPAGLTLATGTGIVSGTPTTVGPFSFTLRATDAAAKIGTEGIRRRRGWESPDHHADQAASADRRRQPSRFSSPPPAGRLPMRGTFRLERFRLDCP